MKSRLIDVVTALCTGLFLLSATATAQQALVTKALTEKKVSQLPARPLYWRGEKIFPPSPKEAGAGCGGVAGGGGGEGWCVWPGGGGGGSAGGGAGGAGGARPPPP